MIGNIYFYTPIEPLKTGTAHYIDLVLNLLEQSPFQTSILLVIDSDLFDQEVNEYRGYRVIDYRQTKRTADDITIYFLANNEYHRYIHKSLHHHLATNGLAVSVVHEPAMWMNIEAMCTLRQYGYTQDDLKYFAAYDFGSDTEWIVAQNNEGRTDKIFPYSTLAATHVYEQSDIIAFHSRYALAKYCSERSVTYIPRRENEPKYMVISHAPEKISKEAALTTEKNKFSIGVFGWINPSKQIVEIVDAFEEFYQALSENNKQKVELRIVGKSNPDYDVAGYARDKLSSDAIKLYGYVSNDDMDRMIAESSLFVSLRFPSCGESSGPLTKANAAGCKTVVSEYAAFSEEPADYHVSVDRDEQHRQLVDIFLDEYQVFPDKRERQASTQMPENEHYSIHHLLAMAKEMSDNRKR